MQKIEKMKKLSLFLILLLTQSYCTHTNIGELMNEKQRTPAEVKKAGGIREMIPMSDGTFLTTDLYLPEGLKKVPCVVARSINDITSMIRYAESYRKAGIAFVAQEIRGHGSSQGEKIAHLHDGWTGHQDGITLTNWIRKQEWSNGIIGTWGPSNVSILSQQLSGADSKIAAQTFFV